jgi:hypothetical protein
MGAVTVSGGDEARRAGFTFGEENAAGLWFALSLLVMLATRRPRRWCWRVSALGAGERIMVDQQTWGLFLSSGFLGRGPVTTEYTLRQQEAGDPKEAHNDWVAAPVERGRPRVHRLLPALA